jgi:hypothetical protein
MSIGQAACDYTTHDAKILSTTGGADECFPTSSAISKADCGAFSSKCAKVSACSSRRIHDEQFDISPGNVVRARSEPIDLHWLLRMANSTWTAKDLKSVKSKLKQVGVFSYANLEEILKEKGMLNNRLREHGLKAFGTSTLDEFRKAVNSERERQRQAAILAMQREQRRLEQESKAFVEEGTSSCVNASEVVHLPQDEGSRFQEFSQSVDPEVDEVLSPPLMLPTYEQLLRWDPEEEESFPVEPERHTTIPPQVASPCIRATKQLRRSITAERKITTPQAPIDAVDDDEPSRLCIAAEEAAPIAKAFRGIDTIDDEVF